VLQQKRVGIKIRTVKMYAKHLRKFFGKAKIRNISENPYENRA